MATDKTKRRYPGVYPFSNEQENIFFGRDNDISKLQTLIKVENQVLLYSKSGIGKTSLLNAGVVPKLPENIETINIRFFAYNKKNGSTSPINRIIDIIKNQYFDIFENTETIIDKLIENKEQYKILWYYLKKLQLAKDDKTFLFVFDQFEELFSYPADEIAEFKQQLHKLINNQIPEIYSNLIENKIEEDIDFFNADDFKLLHKSPDIKNIFAIRSDRLSLLNQLTDKIPDIQKIFYELKPLNTKQIEQAIIMPAKDKGDFYTKPFEYDKQAVDNIINALSDNQKQAIETTQLQIVCQRIEDIAEEKSKQNDGVEIKVADLPKFQDIFFDFYEKSVSKTSEKSKVQKFIEEQLIRNNQRISLDEIVCSDYIKRESLKILTDAHLLRAERNSTGGFAYELSHDTLVEPILISLKQRTEKEAKERAEAERQRELEIAKEKAEKERIEREKERKQQRKIMTIIAIAAVISIAFGIFGFYNMRKAERTLEELIKNQYNKYIEDGYKLTQQARYEEAIDKYKDAQNLLPNIKASQDSINFCLQKLELKETFEMNLLLIDSLINIDKYEAALKLADDIKSLNYNNKIIQQKCIIIKGKGSAFYTEKAAGFYVNNERELAKSHVKKALFLDPNNKKAIKLSKKLNH